MYKMGILPDENNATITVINADGKTVDVVVEFEFTDITSKGEVSLGVIPKTGPATVPIPLIGMANMDGSIAFDLTEDSASGFGILGVSGASLTVADPKVASDIKGLAKAAKAKKRADREYILASQEEMVARTGAKTVISNVADNVGKLSGLLPTNQKIKVASDILNALDKDDLEGKTLVEAIGAAQDAALSSPAAPSALGALGAAAVEVAELTASVNRQITELQKVSSAKISAKAKKVAKKETVAIAKKELKKAATNIKKWNKGK